MSELAQVQNPRTRQWILINKKSGQIIKISDGEEPFAGIPIVKKLKRR